MARFPQPGSVTVCEIDRKLITAESLSEDRAKEAWETGGLFSPIRYRLDYQAPPHTDRGLELPVNSLSAFLQAVSYGPLKRLLGPDDAKLVAHVDIKCVSWHERKDILAFVSAPNQVTIRDYGDSGGEDPCILINDLQREAKVLEWRPNTVETLSVGCKGGICIWAALYPGNTACGVSYGSIVRDSGVCWTLVDFLRVHDNEQISALSWSPDGSICLILGILFHSMGFNSSDGKFYLWQTKGWKSRRWFSGFLTGAAWGPNGNMILLAFQESLTLGFIHFATNRLSDIEPFDLPELKSLTDSRGIEKIAWDATGKRLAVSYKDGKDEYKGLIAIYDIERATLITASLIGFIRGPGDDPKPLTFSFHNKYKQGPLLSVCWSTGTCVTYPLLIPSA